jgi:tRNA(fMet)-specific endonuclease VapC
MMYVLDTNTLIYFFKGSGNVSTHLLSKPPSDIAIPSIVLFELEVGIGKSINPDKRKKQLKDFLSVVHLIPFGYEAAQIAADIRVNLENQGLPIGPYDVLIAASAMSVQGTLVTHNTKEFQRVNDLKIEDWY